MIELNNFIDFSGERNYVFCLLAVYGAVAFAMAIDFVVGVRKARMVNIATRSRGFKMTCDKAVKYFLPMLVLTCVDIIGSLVMSIPVFTMLMGAFNIFCEWKSVLESTHDKAEIRRAQQTIEIIVKNKNEIAKLLSELIKENEEEKK